MMITYSRGQIRQSAMIVEADRLCRLCLARPDVGNLLPIFSNEQTSNILLRIAACLGFQVTPEYCLPNAICVNCHNEVNRFYAFKKKCQITYDMLDAHLKANNDQDLNGIDTIVPPCSVEEQSIINLKNDNNIMNTDISNENPNIIEIPLTVDDNVEQTISNIIQENGEALHVMEVIKCPEKVFENNQMENMTIVNENCIADMQEVLVSECTSETSHSPPQTENCENDTFSVLAEELVKVGVLQANAGSLDLNMDYNGILQLVTADGALLTLRVQEESESEHEESMTVSLPSELAVWRAGGVSYECAQCHHHYEDRNAYLKHLQKHTQSQTQKRCKTYVRWCCGSCGKQFSCRSAMQRHQRVHSGERPFRCDTCSRRFKQKEVLLRHITLHCEKRPFACSQCPKSFTQRTGLQSHERSHAPPAERSLQLHRCPICPKVFLHASGLSRHQTTHDGRVYFCVECRRTFSDKSSLRRHMHTAHKPPVPPQMVPQPP